MVNRFRIVVVDDNVTARMGARALIAASEAFRLVGEAASGHEALKVVASTRPDLVLMDVHMDGMTGAETTRRLLAERPEIPIVAWTSSVESDDLVEMMHAGCVGYTLKDLGPSELNKALLLALRGEPPIPRQLVSDVVKKVRVNSGPPPTLQLTSRELDVLQRMAQGRLTKQIATDLGISIKSVEAYAATICQKLGVRNRTQAVGVAVQWGLIVAPKGS